MWWRRVCCPSRWARPVAATAKGTGPVLGAARTALHTTMAANALPTRNTAPLDTLLPTKASPPNSPQADTRPITAAYLSTTGDMASIRIEVRPQAAAGMAHAAASIAPQPNAAASQGIVDQFRIMAARARRPP